MSELVDPLELLARESTIRHLDLLEPPANPPSFALLHFTCSVCQRLVGEHSQDQWQACANEVSRALVARDAQKPERRR